MIYRKWSLLTGPAVILGGVVGTLVVANFILFDKDPFSGPTAKKQEPATSNQLNRKTGNADCIFDH